MRPHSTPRPAPLPSSVALVALAFLAPSLVLHLAGLGLEPLRDWDEGTVVQVAREIAANGWRSLIHPTLWGEPYLNKPPLLHALIALSFAWLGESAFAARLPGALLSALSVPLVYLLMRRLSDREDHARWSAMVALSLLGLVRHGRLAMLDGAVVTFFLLMLILLLRAGPGQQGRRVAALGAGLCVSLMALTKGLLALPLLAIGLGFLAIRRPRPWNGSLWNRSLLAGLGIGALPAVLWFAIQLRHYGETYRASAVVDQGLLRLWQAVEGNSGTPAYYLLELLKLGGPWLLVLPAGLVLAWHQRAQDWARLSLVWFAGFGIVITLMPTKLPWYIHPLWPCVALICGAAISEARAGKGRIAGDAGADRLLAAGLWGLPVLALAGIGGAVLFSPLGPDPVPALVLAALLVALSAGGAFGLWQWRRPGAFVLLAGGLFAALVCIMVSGRAVWEVNESYPVEPVALMLRDTLPEGAHVQTTQAIARPSLAFYAGHQIVARPGADLRDDALPGSHWLVPLHQVDPAMPGLTMLGRAGGFALVRIEPLDGPLP